MYKLILAIVFLFITSQAQFSASFHVNVPMPPPPPVPPQGFVILPYDDDDMNRSDLVVISPHEVGFWVLLPSGNYVLHCRTMQYDRNCGEWYYGPWHLNYNMTYNRYRHSSFYNRNFHDYMKERYPKYYDRRFIHHERQEWKEERQDRRDWDREKKEQHDDKEKRHDREHR